MNRPPGHIAKKTRFVYFWLWLEAARENFWGRHTLCRIFRPIDWYHSLVPKSFFSGVIQDLGPFLESSFWPITRKRLFFLYTFDFEVPLFFNFLSDGLFTFLGGWPFLKTFPIIGIHSPRSPLSLTRSEEIYLFWKTVKCHDNAFIWRSPNFRPKMADAGWMEEEDDMAEKCWVPCKSNYINIPQSNFTRWR